MASNLPRYTLRIDPDLLKKMHIIADFHGRSTNKEIEVLIRKYVNEFEKEHGKLDDKQAY